MTATLYLSNNNIGDEGAIAIAEALKVTAVLKNLRKANALLGERRKTVEAKSKMLAFHSHSNRELPDIRSGLPCSGARVKTSSTTTPRTPSEPPPSRDSRSICDGWRPKPRHAVRHTRVCTVLPYARRVMLSDHQPGRDIS